MLVWKAIFTRRKDSIKIKMYVFQVFKYLNIKKNITKVIWEKVQYRDICLY